MSLKSKKQLMDAIFYAKEDPKKLFDILFPAVKDDSVNTSIRISGATSLQLSATVSVTTAAPTVVVSDQYGDAVTSPTVTYAIKAAVTGCTVDAGTGVLTATTSAVAGSKPVIVATCGALTAELEVTLVAAA